MCAGNELFFCMLYLLHFTSGPICKYHYNNCLFPVHLCKQYCLKHSTLVFLRLVVLSPENNHTHPTEVPMTILRGEGVLQGGGGGEGVVQGYSKNFFMQGYGYFLEQHNTVKLCKRLCSDQSYYLDLLYVF